MSLASNPNNRLAVIRGVPIDLHHGTGPIRVRLGRNVVEVPRELAPLLLAIETPRALSDVRSAVPQADGLLVQAQRVGVAYVWLGDEFNAFVGATRLVRHGFARQFHEVAGVQTIEGPTGICAHVQPTTFALWTWGELYPSILEAARELSAQVGTPLDALISAFRADLRDLLLAGAVTLDGALV